MFPSSRRKFVVESTLAVPSGSSLDYLSDRLLASYFEAREHESYYKSLKHVDTRRDFHEAIIPILMDFVGEALSSLNTAALDAVIDAAAMARNVIRRRTTSWLRQGDCIQSDLTCSGLVRTSR
jgi:hypothetical protein